MLNFYFKKLIWCYIFYVYYVSFDGNTLFIFINMYLCIIYFYLTRVYTYIFQWNILVLIFIFELLLPSCDPWTFWLSLHLVFSTWYILPLQEGKIVIFTKFPTFLGELLLHMNRLQWHPYSLDCYFFYCLSFFKRHIFCVSSVNSIWYLSLRPTVLW